MKKCEGDKVWKGMSSWPLSTPKNNLTCQSRDLKAICTLEK